LRKEDFPFGSVSCTPPLQPPLQGPDLAVGELPRILSLQRLEQRLRYMSTVLRHLKA
jgi:hypothetical protein